MWIILHSLTGKPVPFNVMHIVRVFEDENTRTTIATADGKVPAVKETVEDVMRILTRVGETLIAT